MCFRRITHQQCSGLSPLRTKTESMTVLVWKEEEVVGGNEGEGEVA